MIEVRGLPAGPCTSNPQAPSLRSHAASGIGFGAWRRHSLFPFGWAASLPPSLVIHLLVGFCLRPPGTRQLFDSSPLPWRLRLLGFLCCCPISPIVVWRRRSPRFRDVPFIRDGVSDHGRAVAPRMTVRNMLPSAYQRLGLCRIISFAAQYPTPHDRCVRFAAVVTGDHATLARGRLATALPSPVFHRLDRASFAWRTDNQSPRCTPRNEITRPLLGRRSPFAGGHGDNMVAAIDAVASMAPSSFRHLPCTVTTLATSSVSVPLAPAVRAGQARPPCHPADAETVADTAATKGRSESASFWCPGIPPTADRPQPGPGGDAKHPYRSTWPAGDAWAVRTNWRAPTPTQTVIDHLGLTQPFEPPAPADAWADLPKLLALAAHPNIVVKISGACTYRTSLSRTRTSGIRCSASSTPLASIAACGELFTARLSDSDRTTLMGGTLSGIYNWSPSKA